jgi:hypothetical protein
VDNAFRITIYTANSAFGDTTETTAHELVRILSELQRQLLADPTRLLDDDFVLRDANGNTVGSAELRELRDI